MPVRDNQLISRCFECKQNDDNDLIKRFANVCQFCDGDTNKFILLLRRVIYPYEYMDS